MGLTKRRFACGTQEDPDGHHAKSMRQQVSGYQEAYENCHALLGIPYGGFPKLGVPMVNIVENQMEKKMENEMETGIL